MQTIITEKQARQITGGRKPLVPIQYEDACRLLAECATIDSAIFFANKADALATWAKIYHEDKAGANAKRLKLKAYRLIGDLARELRPGGLTPRGRLPGPKSLLEEHGLGTNQVKAALQVSRLPRQRFDEFVNSPSPPSPSYVSNRRVGVSREYQTFDVAFSNLLSNLRKNAPAKQFVQSHVAKEEVDRLRSRVEEAMAWLDEFEQHLPK